MMYDKLANILFIFFIIIKTYLFFDICYSKELQIDEVSTYMQCNQTSVFDVTKSINTGFNLIPGFYFYVTYYLNYLIGDPQIAPRVINILALIILTTFIYLRIKVRHNSSISLYYVVLHYAVFNLTFYTISEARPYFLYFIIFYSLITTIYTFKNNNLDKFLIISSTVILLNIFHFSLLYILGVIISLFLLYHVKRDINLKKIICFLIIGLVIGSLINTYTAISQYLNSYNISLTDNKISFLQFKENINSLFAFPFFFIISLFLISLFGNFKFKKSLIQNGESYYILIISCTAFILTSFLLYIIAHLTHKSVVYTRYIIPSFFIFTPFILLISSFTFEVTKNFKNKSFVILCIFMMLNFDLFCQFKTWKNLYVSNQRTSLINNFIIDNSIVITHNIELAKRLHIYHKNCTSYLLVCNNDIKEYFYRFSKSLNVITIHDLYSLDFDNHNIILFTGNKELDKSLPIFTNKSISLFEAPENGFTKYTIVAKLKSV